MGVSSRSLPRSPIHPRNLRENETRTTHWELRNLNGYPLHLGQRAVQARLEEDAIWSPLITMHARQVCTPFPKVLHTHFLAKCSTKEATDITLPPLTFPPLPSLHTPPPSLMARVGARALLSTQTHFFLLGLPFAHPARPCFISGISGFAVPAPPFPSPPPLYPNFMRSLKPAFS